MNNKEDKTEIILAQWQTCVEMSNLTSQRRDTMNNIFITLNLALVATVSITWNIKSIFVLIAGILLCVLWLFSIRNYKLLNTEKFSVINNLEKELPTQPFNDEWEKLQKNKKYMDSTKLEKVLPIMFIVLYGLAIIAIIIIKCRMS